MKIVLTTLNAKYTHHSLALRYLQAYCETEFPDIVVREFNINQQLPLIFSELVAEEPDILGFSCYIWNIEQTLDLIRDLKKVLPHLIVVLGGPEVSYEYEELFTANSGIDYIVAGEGEKPLLELLRLLTANPKPSQAELKLVPGLIYRTEQGLAANPQVVMDLAEVPAVYKKNTDGLENKIVYYETSRGCPYRCEYCLSSRTGNVRYFPLERCKEEITILANLGIQQVRFVDRTFNCDPERFMELVKHMISLDTDTRFQLEISGDLLTEEMIQLLESAPPNRLQFEIGVQSTNQPTLREVGRYTNLDKLSQRVTELRERTNVRFLLDLIAGLPGETYQRFAESFDYVYNLHPTKIQLGFLKLLKGSRLRERASEFGYEFTEKSPYEVLKNDHISYQELADLKIIEGLVESLVNSGRFKASLDYLIAREGLTPFCLFEKLARSWKALNYHLVSHSIYSFYLILWEFIGNSDPILLNYLRYDFRFNESKRDTPNWLGGVSDKSLERQLIGSELLFDYLPHLADLRLSPRELSRNLYVEEFEYQIYPWSATPEHERQILLFYYGDPYRTKVYVLPVDAFE